MHLKNTIEIVRAGWRRHFGKVPVANMPEGDAKMLSAMCAETVTMTASNGRTYWYFFPLGAADNEIVRYLMERNGVVPTFRMSRYGRYNGDRRAAFRISEDYLLQHPHILNFVEKIRPVANRQAGVTPEQIQLLRQAMKSGGRAR